MPLYDVTHTTRYRHRAPATASWQSLRLQPKQDQVQSCESFSLEILPVPKDLTERADYFGNAHHVFTLREPHTELIITSRSRVRREEPVVPMEGLTPSLAEVRERMAAAVRLDYSLEQFRGGSPYIPLLPGARKLAEDFTRGLDPQRTPVLSWVTAFGERFDEEFTFDPKATRVSTPLAEVLARRRGVCQDFAHLFTSALRQCGLPAAYVSGYLLTNPPPGRPRLVGADASHAWVSFFVPDLGWIDYDPTNACLVGSRHVTVARGRDFSDVSPVQGLFSGGGAHVLDTGVTVAPVEFRG